MKRNALQLQLRQRRQNRKNQGYNNTSVDKTQKIMKDAAELNKKQAQVDYKNTHSSFGKIYI